jgi:hypothetical protein
MSSADDNAGFAEELPGKAADLIDEFVDRVHQKVVRPIIIAARAIVFGLLMISVALLAIVVASVGAIRLFNVYLFHGHVWASYAIIGAVLFGAGLFVFNKHHQEVEGGLRD